MTLQGILVGILVGGLVTVVLTLLRPRSHAMRIGSAFIGLGIAYLIMRLM